MKESKLFSREENRDYRLTMLALAVESLNVDREWLKCFSGMKTAQKEMSELRGARQLEIQRRKQV